MSVGSLQVKEISQNSKRCCESLNKTLHRISHEPSLGLYRIQENIYKILPKVADLHKQFREENQKLEDQHFDILTAIDVVKDISKTEETFCRIEKSLAAATTSAALINMKKSKSEAAINK